MEHMEEYRIPEEAIERLRDPEVIRRQMEEGKTFQEIIGYSNQTMDKFYQIAHGLFQQQEYSQAADAFVFLTTLNPYTHNYWLGLGMSEQLSGSYQGALLAYAMAILTDIENPVAHYHSASCYRAVGDRRSALQSLKMALRCAEESEGFDYIKAQAASAMQVLENEMKRGGEA